MKNRYCQAEASRVVARYGAAVGEDLALRTYTSRLLGAEPKLVLHGGGNTSVKTTWTDLLGRTVAALYVKASGHDMATIEPAGHVGLELAYLKSLHQRETLCDEVMVNAFRTHLFDAGAPTPSIETLMHAFIDAKFIDHTHADAILALTNQVDGARLVRAALGAEVLILDYVRAGFELAKAVWVALAARPKARAIVLMQHGVVSWGQTAKEAYDTMIGLVTQAESYLDAAATRPLQPLVHTPLDLAHRRLRSVAPLVRGVVSPATADPDRPWRRMICQPLVTRQVLDLVDLDRGQQVAMTAAITGDHLIRTKALPMWVEDPDYDDLQKLHQQLKRAVADYSRRYDDYVRAHRQRLAPQLKRFDPLPRVVLLPGLGALCWGPDVEAARIVAHITDQSLAVKAQVAAMGSYRGLADHHLFDMEYHRLQHAKLAGLVEPPLAGSVALVTGAAGAIGAGVCRGLLAKGCHVAATDVESDRLASLADELAESHGRRIIGCRLDVTDPDSVVAGFGDVIEAFGGIDLIVVNAGAALVSTLARMDLAAFGKLAKVNIQGTLLLLQAAAHHFARQRTGGDIVVISTKNVFAPGAGFGAYSATKAASHQLGRIASLELAELDVRVNMVAPDAVFADGSRKSGLWKQVGPDRMKARGLDEAGLEAYYRNRNLLKARITADHVAKAVLYFATRQTPTTGATIPVDGGLPDATPR